MTNYARMYRFGITPWERYPAGDRGGPDRGRPTLEVWACELLCLVLVMAGRPQVMAAEL